MNAELRNRKQPLGAVCSINRHHGVRPPRRRSRPEGQVRHPRIRVGTRREYSAWEHRARRFLAEMGRNPLGLERVDATINYGTNEVRLFNLPDAADELSIGGTLSHEFFHSLLEQLGEQWAARVLDRVARRATDPERQGGL